MSRQFDGSADRIATTIAAGLASYTYGTWAVLLKMSVASDGAWAGIMNLHTTSFTSGGSSRAGLEKGDTSNDNRMNLVHGGSSRKNPDAITSSDGWLLFVVGKGTGTVTPTWSLRPAGSSGTWSHGSMDGTLANGSSSDSARMVFGQWEGTDDFAGFLAAAAIWDEVNLDNTQRETLWPGSAAGEMADWLDLTPTHAWQFNQASTGTAVEDLMNNGGDETAINGTAVSGDEPANWTYFSAGADGTATPAVISLTAALPAATTSAGSTATPAVLAATAALPAAAPSAGSTVTPAAIAVAAALPAAVAAASSTATPAAVAVTSALPGASVSAGATASPATVAVAASLPAAVATAGSTATPAVAALTAALPSAAATAGSTAAPATLAATASLPAAAASAGATVSPAVAALTITIPGPSVSGSGSATVSPDVIALTAALPTASAAAGALVSPATLALVAALPVPALAAGATASPATVPLTIALPPASNGQEPGPGPRLSTETLLRHRTTSTALPRLTTQTGGSR